ncbi:hypothetical protein [Shouchella patagoniensis]|uniref:hypothetical protein n=1 Tax=Shouchella patagoniensis TaxID=228576 RepID=UPI0014765D77|nr:hypothetical protein [Shouchella patagoniensis]
MLHKRRRSFLNLLPVATMFGAYFPLKETIASMYVLGSVIVIVGVFLVMRGESIVRKKE